MSEKNAKPSWVTDRVDENGHVEDAQVMTHVGIPLFAMFGDQFASEVCTPDDVGESYLAFRVDNGAGDMEVRLPITFIQHVYRQLQDDGYFPPESNTEG